VFGIDAAVLQVKINEGTIYPTAQLVGTVNQNWETNLTSALQQFNAFVQAQVTVPLYPSIRAGPSIR
jgi:outer membrane protein